MKKTTDKSRLFTNLVVVLLVAIFAGGFIWGLNKVLAMEGAMPPAENVEGLTPAPETEQAVVDYVNAVIAKAVEEKPHLASHDSFDIDSDSVTTDGSDRLLATLSYVKDGFTAHLENSTEDAKADFGIGFDGGILRVPQFSAADIESFTCDYIYYQCASCGETADTVLENCEACGSVYPYGLRYRDEYTITVNFAPCKREDVAATPVIKNNFGIRSDDTIAALTAEEFGDAITVSNLEITYEKSFITVRVDRLTDEIIYLGYTKEMPVSADVTFNGKYSSVGKCSIGCVLTENVHFDFTWPAITLSDSVIVIEPKGTDNLLATLTCDNPLNYTVKWSSSDESVATVDAEGYISAAKTAGSCQITAEFEFQGKTYSDTCEVRVRVPVESVLVSDRKVEMNVGDTVTLSAKVSPSDASVRTVTWYTENADVATVDENGVITAVSAGDVKVYALSDDGYYKSTCEVIVK